MWIQLWVLYTQGNIRNDEVGEDDMFSTSFGIWHLRGRDLTKIYTNLPLQSNENDFLSPQTDDVFLIQAIHLGNGYWHCQQIRRVISTNETSLKKSVVFVQEHVFAAVIKDVATDSALTIGTQRAENHWPI